jgi:hypothetical protein
MFGRRFVSVRGASAIGVFLLVADWSVACGVRTPLTEGPYELSSKDASPTPTGSFRGGDAAIADAEGDAGTNPDDASANTDVALPPADLGDIRLTSGVYSSGAVFAATAQFFPSVAVTGCTIAPSAGCTMETCDAQGVGANSVAGAGSIAVAGGLYPLLLDQRDGGQYGPATDDGSVTLWHGGEGLIVSASGDAVPAFVDDVVAPTQVTVLTPMPPFISRAAPFAFSWLGASAGKLTVDLSTTSGQTDYYLQCQFDVGVGIGTLPDEALRLLQPGPAQLRVSTVNESDVKAGSWLVKTFAQTSANDPYGAAYNATVQIQ